MPMGIVVISCVRPSVQPSMGLGLCIAYKALGRNGLQFGMLMYPDGLHSAFMDAYGYCCWSVCPSICPFVRLGHYWEMAVAITCGYGGYLLPLLAAHSSQTWRKKTICWMESLIKLWVYKLQLPIFYELSNFQSFVIVVRLLRASRLYIWLVPKLPVIILVAISRLWLGTGLRNRRFNFLLY